MTLREYLLSKKGFSDSLGNQLFFSDRGLNSPPKGEEFWIFLDEGLRCGGMARQIACTKDAMGEVLLGCGKQELFRLLLEEIASFDEKCGKEENED